MSAAHQSTEDAHDKLTEVQFAAFLGTTVAALRTRRFRKQIPEGVWIKLGRETIYSKRRYDEWLENQWTCPPGWKSSATPSASASPGTEDVAAKHFRFPSRKKASRLHPDCVLM